MVNMNIQTGRITIYSLLQIGALLAAPEGWDDSMRNQTTCEVGFNAALAVSLCLFQVCLHAYFVSLPSGR